MLPHYLAKEETQKTAHCSALCVQHSPTAAALSTSFLLNHVPNSVELDALIAIFRQSFSSVIMSHESKRLKKSGSDWLNFGNLRENAIFMFLRFASIAPKHNLFEVT